MSSLESMSLDEIIQKKKENARSKYKLKRNNMRPHNGTIIDARKTIILRRKNQITDAREKLIEFARQRDARLKLDMLKKKRDATFAQGRNFQYHGQLTRSVPNKQRVSQDPTRQVVSQSFSQRKVARRQSKRNRDFGDRIMISRRLYDNTPNPIINNERNILNISDDPMGEECVSEKISPLKRKTLQIKVIAHNDNTWDSRTPRFSLIDQEEKNAPKPLSILKKRPMAALGAEKANDKAEKSSVEYRIIVSNLRSSVTGGDIQELFGDVGGMLESRLVRPGTAEVIYKTVEDAQRAVDLYHNRQLDGQPMNCLLVIPRSTKGPIRDASKPALVSTSSNVEPDISTFHKVLFSNF